MSSRPIGRRSPLFCLAIAGALTCLAASSPAPARPARRDVTRVRVTKHAHRMDLLRGDEVVATYRVALGPGGAGPKLREGDAITPVGRYRIVGRGPSRFRVFLRLDYPNAEDRARFARLAAAGALPRGATIGGDIGIHGAPPDAAWKAGHKDIDWTLGCVAVDDDEIDAIAARVADGTPVDIED